MADDGERNSKVMELDISLSTHKRSRYGNGMERVVADA